MHPPHEIFPLSYPQERFWLLHHLEPAQASNRLVSAVRLRGALNTNALAQCVDWIVARHEALRTYFPLIDRTPRQAVLPEFSVPMTHEELRGVPEQDRGVEALRRMHQIRLTPCDLSQGPLSRAFLLQFDEEDHVLFLLAHHAVMDGRAIDVFLQDLATMYPAAADGQPCPLLDLGLQYRDYTAWQLDRLESGALQSQLDYWIEELRDCPQPASLTSDGPPPEPPGADQGFVRSVLEGSLLEQLRALRRTEGTSLFTVLLATFNVLLLRPVVPVRQWVLTLPIALRYRLAYDADLTTAVLREFLRAVFTSLRRRARRVKRIDYPHCGAVTFVQRFGDALNLNVHFHSLVLDGVYDLDDPRGGQFITLPPPEIDEIHRILVRFIRRLELLLEREGLGPDADPTQADCLHEEQPLLAGLAGASVRGRIAAGSRAGQRVRRLGDRVETEDLDGSVMPCSATVAGFSLHAAVCVPARDRKRLERLCRYAARPPVASERLSRREDGKLVYRLRHRWRDGTTHVLFDGVELVEKLAALVPRPRSHMVRYHGILAPAASRRDEVVPSVLDESLGAPEGQCSLDADSSPPNAVGREKSHGSPQVRRLSWAQLMQRVFQLDVMVCPRCSGALRIMAEIRSPAAIRAILKCLKLPSRPPPIAPASQDGSWLVQRDSESASPIDDIR